MSNIIIAPCHLTGSNLACPHARRPVDEHYKDSDGKIAFGHNKRGYNEVMAEAPVDVNYTYSTQRSSDVWMPEDYFRPPSVAERLSFEHLHRDLAANAARRRASRGDVGRLQPVSAINLNSALGDYSVRPSQPRQAPATPVTVPQPRPMPSTNNLHAPIAKSSSNRPVHTATATVSSSKRPETVPRSTQTSRFQKVFQQPSFQSPVAMDQRVHETAPTHSLMPAKMGSLGGSGRRKRLEAWKPRNMTLSLSANTASQAAPSSSTPPLGRVSLSSPQRSQAPFGQGRRASYSSVQATSAASRPDFTSPAVRALWESSGLSGR